MPLAALPLIVANKANPLRTAYTITVDVLGLNLTIGILVANRVYIVRILADLVAIAASFKRLGYVVPLVAREGLTRVRKGYTEAALELCRLAGKELAAAICEMVVNGEAVEEGRPELVGGRMMRRDDCLAFRRRWGIKVCTIEDIVEYVEVREGKLKGH